jgi:hypothetical protein
MIALPYLPPDREYFYSGKFPAASGFAHSGLHGRVQQSRDLTLGGCSARNCFCERKTATYSITLMRDQT